MFMKIISSVKFSKQRVDVSQIEGKEEQSVASQVIDVTAVCAILVDVKGVVQFWRVVSQLTY